MHKRVISLGLGQQSTALYFMSCMEELPKADIAIFADPGAELPDTYMYLEWLMDWQIRNDGIPIVIAKNKHSIYEELINGRNENGKWFSSIPAYIKKDNGEVGTLRRQCTGDYKVKRVNKAIRDYYGLKKYGRTPATEIWLGITLDEISRVRYPDNKWQTLVYPFCNYKTEKSTGKGLNYALHTRSDCVRWLAKMKLPVPPKSSCFFCPYQGNESWLRLKRQFPKVWEQAVELDYRLRDSKNKGVKYPIYLHRQCIPLDQANLSEDQLELFEECEGHCGV
ncbi:hypothetical protein JMN32_05425 [Fulvivirga sp. 29W222]|uniref:Phosphoadenosine phosphosulphate reductase domain-containing protein n=1 Tax=Fulvivirga marina TaxID=2494733 RepID=A0A937FTT1_9BACT|nr:hypothetical protein [Fulvivirga marina]MBL6445739.1 hypothetical protein [Fulvivirga marina]